MGAFEFRRLGMEPDHFVTLGGRLRRGKSKHSVHFQVLEELCPRRLVFNQNTVGLVVAGLLMSSALQLRVIHATTKEVEQIIPPVISSPGRAYTEVIELPALVGRIPTLHPVGESLRKLPRLVVPDPLGLHHGAADGHGVLLPLAGKVIFPDGCTHALQSGFGLALRMKNITRIAPEYPPPQRTVDEVNLIFFRNCRKRQQLPIMVLQHMPHQVILVQLLPAEFVRRYSPSPANRPSPRPGPAT